MEKPRSRSIGRPVLKGAGQAAAAPKETEKTVAPKPETPELDITQRESAPKRSSEGPRLRVGITPGDGTPLHYGALARLFSDSAVFDGVLPFVYGSAKLLGQASDKTGKEEMRVLVQRQIQDIKGRHVQVIEPADTPGEEQDILQLLQAGIRHMAEGNLRALVTLPLNEEKVRERQADFKNQAVAVAEVFSANPFRMLLARAMRLSFLTTEKRAEMASYLSAQRVEQRIRAMYAALQDDFSITTPRIAVLSSNQPQIDAEVLKPLVTALFEAGMPVFGPYPAKEFFNKPDRDAFDAVLCMYKEQMEKVFDFCPKEDCCYFTAGLPIVHLEPIFGTTVVEDAFRSVFRAVCMAVDIDAARIQNRKLTENPLGYHAASYRRDGREDN
ncbi:MAG: 4-hydroxythreonine-4-phosphate dehydrogenase PdxA [Bacteroides sp.]|nr:4-hydroxythreonine-4-phosphate dehydrogenase PdxA [Bacteroides sp.]